MSSADGTARVAVDGPRFRLLLLGGLTLVRADGNRDSSLVLRGRKLVLLAYLALSRRPIARDRLSTFLWGHRDDDRARHSLRDALSALRQVFGAAIPRGVDQVALAMDAPLDVDVLELREAARVGDHAKVIALYHGPFLDGVHVSDSSEVEDWISEQRHSIGRLFTSACAVECARLAAEGESDACAVLAQRWLEIEPTDASAFVWRLRALAAPDTPTALREAVAEYERLAAQLRNDFDVTPAAAVLSVRADLVDRIAKRSESVAVENSQRAELLSAPPPQPRFTPELAQPALRPAPFRAARFAIGAAVGLALTFIAVLSFTREDASTSEKPELVVAGIESSSQTPEDKWLESGLPQLLASSLIRERVPGVVDPSRVRAARRNAGVGDANGSTDGATAMLVARRLHAATLVSGEITHGGGRFLLDLAIRDVVSGAVRRRIAVSDTSLFGLVDQATARVLAAVDRPGSGFRFEDVETSSVEAYRAYVLALDRMDAGRAVEATQLLDAAVSADSMFAAALQARLLSSMSSLSDAAKDSMRRLSVTLSQLRHESDFDKRGLAFLRAVQRGDAVRAEQIASDVVARYPRDSRAYALHINALQYQGRFAEAGDVATKALALDSTTRTTASVHCATCGLYGLIVTSALTSGDAQRATSAARRAVTLNPGEPAPWFWLSRAMIANGLPDEAIDAAERAIRLAPREAYAAVGLGWLLLEAGRFDAADSLIRDWSRPGSERFLTALDLRGALWRERGQFDSAAKAGARAVARAPHAGDSAALRLVYGNSLARIGDIAAATRTFELAAMHLPDTVQWSRLQLSPSIEARAFAWPHALLADALALSGSRDTLRLLAIADSIEVVGRRSAFGRDSRLHFHLRGLVAGIGGRWAEAERLFERSRWGVGGWTRTNVELARAQLREGRPLDAVTTLRDVRFGTLDGMGRYAPRSEIHASLAEAFVAAQMLDSARVYVARVRSAWTNADPPQRRRLLALERAIQVSPVGAEQDRRRED